MFESTKQYQHFLPDALILNSVGPYFPEGDLQLFLTPKSPLQVTKNNSQINQDTEFTWVQANTNTHII